MYRGAHTRRDLRVLLLGKTGSGKSALGNTLLGTEAFSVARGMRDGTASYESQTRTRFGVDLQVTDTPGLCCTHGQERDVLREIRESVAFVQPGPHVILLVLRSDSRFTGEEYEAYAKLKEEFGDEVCNYMVLAFTGIDTHGDTPELQDRAFKDELRNCPRQLRAVLNEVGGRYTTVSNKGSFRSREQTAEGVIRGLQNLVARNGGVFFRGRRTHVSPSTLFSPPRYYR